MDEFVSIPDYQDYFINRKGEILSKRQKKDRIMKPTINLGYYRLGLRINKQSKQVLVHRLLAKMFIPNPNNYYCVDHINRDRLDNRLENLRWCNYEKNNQNQCVGKTNKSGYKHIYFESKNKKWRIVIIRNKKRVFDKLCKKLEDAVEFRNKILTELGEEII